MDTFVLLLFTLINCATGIPQISLEYNPYPLPSYNPNPGENTAHTVPPGKPWPASPEEYTSFSQPSSVPSSPTVKNRFQETSTTKRRPDLDYGKPPISLEYNPYPLPSYNPNPGENTALAIPPGKPWPTNPEDYNSFSQTSSSRPAVASDPTVENRFQETTTTKRPDLDYGKPPISLEYNPYPLPSYNPNPGENTALAIPPGKPWPANPEDYNSFSQTSSSRPAVASDPTVENRFQETTTTKRPDLDYGKPPISLEYNPYPLPSYNPNPGENTALAIPPGKPWPANPEDYNPSLPTTPNQNPTNGLQETTEPQQKPEMFLIYPEDLWFFMYLSDRFREMISSSTKPSLILDYDPNRPPFRPKPEKIQELESHSTFDPTENQNQVLDYQPNPLTVPQAPPPLIVLDYKPDPRPSYLPYPTEKPQKIPPGKPWPANPEDYATFSQTTSSRPTQNQQQNIENRFPETTTQVQPSVVLDYKPNRPFYRPSPTETQQVVRPGQPGSSKPSQNQQPETTTNRVQPIIVLDYKPNRPFYRPSPTETQQVVRPGKPLPAGQIGSSLNQQQNLENRFQETTTTRVQRPPIVLDYKPQRPFYRPSPTEIQQVVPPGKPWPANPEDYATFSQFGSSKPLQSQQQETTTTRVQPVIVLDYKPNRPFYRPSPTEIQQVVPPGRPWPATRTQLDGLATPQDGSEPIETEPNLASVIGQTQTIEETSPKQEEAKPPISTEPGKSQPSTPTQQATPELQSGPIETKPQPVLLSSVGQANSEGPRSIIQNEEAEDFRASVDEDTAQLMLFTSTYLNEAASILPLLDNPDEVGQSENQ